MWGMQLRVGVGRMPVSASSRTEHHVAALDATFVHFPEVHSRKVDFEGPLITEGL